MSRIEFDANHKINWSFFFFIVFSIHCIVIEFNLQLGLNELNGQHNAKGETKTFQFAWRINFHNCARLKYKICCDTWEMGHTELVDLQ